MTNQRAQARRAGQFAQHMRGKGRPAGIDEFLDQGMVVYRKSGTAHRFGQGHAVKAQCLRALPDLLEQFPRWRIFVVNAVFACQRMQFGLDEGVQLGDEVLRLGRSFEGVGWVSFVHGQLTFLSRPCQ